MRAELRTVEDLCARAERSDEIRAVFVGRHHEMKRENVMKRHLGIAMALGMVLALGQATQAQWTISTFKGVPTVGEINNYATADALIGGQYLETGFPVTMDYALANTQDNGDAGGPFGLGTQVAGLPEGDNNDFVFVGSGQLNVAQTGTYVFVTNTDDGSRLLGSINGGAAEQWITDDVLSGPHDVPSEGIALNSGDTVDFDWMWFERGGGAEGELYYRVDTGAGFGDNALIGDASQGLELVGGMFSGATYKSIVTPGQVINNFADAQAVINTPGALLASAKMDVFNLVGNGSDGDFADGVAPPGISGDVDDYVVVGSGYLKVGPDQAGNYTFRSNTDDGGRLKLDLNQNGTFEQPDEWIIDQDVLQGATNTDSATIALGEGLYKVEYSYFERGGGDEGEVSAMMEGGTFILLGDDAAGGLEVVPEPSTAMLAILGVLGGLGLLRQRK
jgi:hypothetical protein